MNWANDLDLLGPRVVTWPGSWALLLVAALSVVTTTTHLSELRVRQADAQDRLESALPLQRAQRTSVSSTAAASSASSVALPDLSSLESAVALTERWNHPWQAVFAGVETASRDVAMLALRHDATSAIVNIEAAVPNDRAAWQFVQGLGTDTAHFREARLVSREALIPPAGDLAVQVRVQAILKLATANAAGEGHTP